MPAPPYLADTNILLRLTRRGDPDYELVRRAVRTLKAQGATFCYTSQNLVEFWNVATRPKERNGFGLSCGAVVGHATLPPLLRRARAGVDVAPSRTG